MKLLSLKTLLIASLAMTPSFAANIVLNPSFNTGNLNHWVNNTSVAYEWEPSVPGSVNSGCIGEACVDQNNLATANYLYQNLNTPAGTTYQLSFDYAADGAPSELKVLWGGNVVLDLVNGASDVTQYVVSNLYASSDTTRLMFLSRQDPGFDYLTNINVDASVAPEPGVTGLLLGGLGVIGAMRFRRKK